MLSALFYVSCSKDKTGTEITLSYYAGDWYGKSKDSSEEKRIITIHTDGSITDNNNQKINPSDITRNSAISYTLQDESKLNFSSATKGTFTAQGTDAIEITKK